MVAQRPPDSDNLPPTNFRRPWSGPQSSGLSTIEIPADLAFGGPDLRTLFFAARTSVHALRVKVPGQPHPWAQVRSR